METSAQEFGSEGQVEEIVKITNLEKSFNNNRILNGVNVSVNKGENLVVLGKSGSGKSVLIKCIVGLVKPDEGQVCVFGNDISRLSYRELNEARIRIGFLFQNGALYDSMTVRENLAFPLRHHFKHLSKSEQQDIVMESLDSVGLKDAAEKMPSELSGGMMKRIGLARTLILKPDIMLYDEPTTGLDTATSKEISALILSMQKQKNISSIIITHDMDCAKTTADRIVMLKEGAIYIEGSFETLQHSDDTWIKSFFA